MERFFSAARPIWAAGLTEEMNITVGLYAALPAAEHARLHITAAGPYRVFANGRFLACGPARCASGFFRVDDLPLPAGTRHLAIEAVNYAVNSYEWPGQPAFVWAEVTADGHTLAATGDDSFTLYRLNERVQRVPRFSFQRPFAEAYRFLPDVHGWRTGRPGAQAQPAAPEAQPVMPLLPRRIAPFSYPEVRPSARIGRGTLTYPCPPDTYRRDRSLTIGDPSVGALQGYPVDRLDWDLSRDVQDIRCAPPVREDTPYPGATTLTAGEYEVLRLPGEHTGYPAFTVACREDSTLWLLVDEGLTPQGTVDPLSMECLNAIPLALAPGRYTFQSVEALGFGYLQLCCTSGAVEVQDLRLIEAVCPQPIIARYVSRDPRRQQIFDAACQTFRQNATDIFMDCPTRERAGWLCDSFFTARTEHALTGENRVEYNFLENYLLPRSFPHLPDGMVPMCYPADHPDGNFIPNWAMWLVLELEDHLRRTGDRTLTDAFFPRVEGICRWLSRYENADGLLERLDGWVFLEWSHANDLTQDINFPTNMLYARMLTAAAALYPDRPQAAGYAKKAAHLRSLIRRRSFDGAFFTDNEVYRDGTPVPSGETTETCQYYAFFCDIATPQSHPALWQTLLTQLGPQRIGSGALPQLSPSNAFIGNYLRLEILRRYRQTEQLLREIDGYFGYMAERTGTLWENTGDYASCCHGFASYAAALLLEADPAART